MRDRASWALLLSLAVLLALSTLSASSENPKQQMIEARLVVVAQNDPQELGFVLRGSAWGKRQPSVGEQIGGDKKDYVSLLVSKRDGVFFQKAKDEGTVFDRWLVSIGKKEPYVLLAPNLVSVNDRAEAVLVVVHALEVVMPRD